MPSPSRRAALLLALAAAALATAVGVAWAATGELSYSERVPAFDTDGGREVVASPDGKYLYVAAGRQLTALGWDAAAGAFMHVETERDGIDDPNDSGGPVDGLNPVRDVVISPDGMFLYTAAYQGDSAVGVFERDPATGRLSFLEVERDGADDPEDAAGPVEEMFRPEALAISADGASVYVVTESDDTIVAFERDKETGRLSYQETQSTVVANSDVEVSPDGKGVFVASESGDHIQRYSRAGDGSLTYLGATEDGVEEVTGLDSPRQLEFSPDGDWLFVAGRHDAALVLFKRDPGSQDLLFVEAEVNGVDDPGDPGGTLEDLSLASGIAVSPDGENVYVAGGGSDAVGTFRFDPSQGQVSYVETHRAGVAPTVGPAPTGLSFPEGMVVSPDGDNLYVGGGGQSGLAAFDRLGSEGLLSFLLTEPTFSLRWPRGVAFTPDGRVALVASLIERSLRSFARDPVSGGLDPRDTETSEVDDPSDPGPVVEGLEEPTAIAVAANGTDVYVTDTSAYSVSLFRLNPETGELTYVESEFNETDDPGDPGGEVFGLYEPWDVVISPDGTGLFAPGSSDDAVAAFDRDPATGRLSFVESEVDGVGGVDGLAGAEDLAVAPDGGTVYVAGRGDDAVAVFARDPATNELTFLEAEVDGEDDAGDPGPAVEGLADPHDVVVLGSALHVATDEGIARFDRDPASGRLSFAALVDPSESAGAPEAADDRVDRLAIGPEGAELYSASEFEEILLVHGLDAGGAIGALLDFEQAGVDDPGDLGGAPEALDRIVDLAVSPDGRHLYAVSNTENGLAIFDRETPPPPAPPAAAAPPTAAPPIASPDTALRGARFAIPRRQAQRGKKIAIKVRLRAGERARGLAWGGVKLGRKGYALRKVGRSLPAGKTRTLWLKPRRGRDARRLSRALRNGRKARANVVARIVDSAGNRATRKATVVLTHRQAKRGR